MRAGDQDIFTACILFLSYMEGLPRRNQKGTERAFFVKAVNLFVSRDFN
jgi:hypothetical protein